MKQHVHNIEMISHVPCRVCRMDVTMNERIAHRARIYRTAVQTRIHHYAPLAPVPAIACISVAGRGGQVGQPGVELGCPITHPQHTCYAATWATGEWLATPRVPLQCPASGAADALSL